MEVTNHCKSVSMGRSKIKRVGYPVMVSLRRSMSVAELRKAVRAAVGPMLKGGWQEVSP